MPLYSTILHNSKTEILVWKITESLDQLLLEATLNEKSKARLNAMKSVSQQRGYLSVRKLLQEKNYSDFDLYYDEFGKPHLSDGKHISVSHSHEFSSIILSDENCGIDLEMQREKITTIAHKFAKNEFGFLNTSVKNSYIRQLTVIWGVKEAIFKIRNEPGISFNDHIQVDTFDLTTKKTKAVLNFGTIQINYEIFFEEIENYTLVFAFEK